MAVACAVIGIGQTKHDATRLDLSLGGLVREAALRALGDAEMTWRDIDAIVLGTAPDMFEGVMMPELYLADALGAAGKPILRVPGPRSPHRKARRSPGSEFPETRIPSSNGLGVERWAVSARSSVCTKMSNIES